MDSDSAAATADSIIDAGGEAFGVRCDVTRRADLDDVVRIAIDRYGTVDVLVNNAGVMPLAFFSDHAAAVEAWDRAIDINVKGVLNGICAVYDQMIRQGRGHVVNISSIYGNAGTAGSGVYSATKAAVRVLSDSLRVEAQGKIKVTVVRPTGVMGTGLGGGVVNPKRSSGSPGSTPSASVNGCSAWEAAACSPRRLMSTTCATGPSRPRISSARSCMSSTSRGV